MATTTNKGYLLMATGDEVDNWGAKQNTDIFTIIDNNMGSVTTKSLTNVNVSLSATESQSALNIFNGTLTGAVQVTTLCKGFVFVENATTGAFALTFTNGVAGVTIPQGQRVIVFCNPSTGCKIFGSDTFPTGTRMPFQQTTVPTGWTKDTDTAYSNAAIRLVTGSVTTGGSMNFTSAFDERIISRSNLPNVTITTTTNGNHNHSYTRPTGGYQAGGGGNTVVESTTGGTTGTDGAHTHTIALNGGVTQTAFDFSVKYVDFTVGVKN